MSVFGLGWASPVNSVNRIDNSDSSGRARAEGNGHAQELGPGDCCFFPADAMHVFTVISDEPVKLLVVYAPPYEESPDRVIRPK